MSVFATMTYGQRVKQPREVVDFDFDRAFEATFTKDPVRRRQIAIAEGEIGGVNVEAAVRIRLFYRMF